MVIKCTKCGYQKIINQPLYSSPIFKCEACGDYFYESRFKEAALYPPPVNVKEKQSFFIYVADVVGLIFIFGGINLAISEKDASFLLYSLIGFLFLILQLFLFWDAEKQFKKREEIYKNLLDESKKRLQSQKYQDLLVTASGSNESIIALLKKYNSQNQIVLMEDFPEETQHIANIRKEVEPVDTKNHTIKNDYLNKNRFCRKCGSKLFDDSAFCHCCGEKIRFE